MHRRSFITGLISLVAAPAIVRAGSLMPVKVMLDEPIFVPVGFDVWADFAEIRRQMVRDYVRADLFYPFRNGLEEIRSSTLLADIVSEGA